jgi:hypothetical protein
MTASARPAKRGLRIRPRPFRLIRTAEDEARHLRELAEVGESGETPALVIGMVVLVLAPIVALVVAGSLLAYYLTT